MMPFISFNFTRNYLHILNKYVCMLCTYVTPKENDLVKKNKM